MSSGSWPNFNAWLQTAWGAGAEYWSSGYAGLFSAATNLVFGQNPPYTLDDFLSVYPVFGFWLSLRAFEIACCIHAVSDTSPPLIHGEHADVRGAIGGLGAGAAGWDGSNSSNTTSRSSSTWASGMARTCASS